MVYHDFVYLFPSSSYNLIIEFMLVEQQVVIYEQNRGKMRVNVLSIYYSNINIIQQSKYV